MAESAALLFPQPIGGWSLRCVAVIIRQSFSNPCRKGNSVKLRSSISLAATALAAAGFVAVAAPSASATPTGLTLTCTSASAQLGCSATWRTDDGRVQIRWAVNGRHLAAADNQRSFRIDCTPGTGYSVTVTVADSTGRASASARELCQRA